MIYAIEYSMFVYA